MTPNPQDSAVALEVERAAFEAHYAKIWKERTRKTESIAELLAVIVTMRDGDEYDNGLGDKPAFINNLWQGWQARASQSDGTSGGWISVDERLPEIGPDEEGIHVWTWDGVTVEHDEFVANYEQPAGPAVGGWLRTDDWFAGDIDSRVTHWQPYTTPPAPNQSQGENHVG